nr:transposase [Pseudoalteromonas spongiae]
MRAEDGEVELDTPRDRDSSFEPKLVKKNQTRFTSMDGKISKGMTTREIVPTFKEMYVVNISPMLDVELIMGQIVDCLQTNILVCLLF